MKGLRPRMALFGALLSACSAALVALALAAMDGSRALTVPFLLASLLAVGAGLLAGFTAGHLLARRLRFLAQAASALGAGDFRARAPESPADEIGAVGAVFNAMAARVRARMASAAEESSRLQAALNSSLDAVAALSPEGRVVFANSALEQLFGRAAGSIIGNPLVWLLPDQEVLDSVRASREQGTRNIRVIERPGRQFLQVTSTPISGGGEWAVLVVFHDLTDVKRLEETRRDFVANVSHELRTPLAGLKSVVEVLADGGMADPAVAEDFLRRADAEVDRLVQLVEELLELSRIESGEVPLAARPTDIGRLLGDAVERLRPHAARKLQSLELDVPAGNHMLDIDPGRMERAVVNLVQNAIKFTPEGGRIRVSTATAEDAFLIEVSDTGSGIAPEALPRIFERFYKADHSRASGGSGLGLALVKHAVESHGGRVEVASRLGEGSTFTIRLPMRPDSRA